MRTLDNLSNGVAVVLWTALCTACGLWFLVRFQGPYCTYCTGSHPSHRTFKYKKNSAAYLEYGRRMRTGFAYQVRAMVALNADLIKKFKAGLYEDHKAEFDADTTAFCNSLLDSIEQFDGQQVPDVLEKSHAKIANCHRLCYESIQALREAYGSQGDERRRLVREAEKKLKEAWITGDAGVKLHNAIWEKTAT